MQGDATPEKLCDAVSALLDDDDAREKISAAFAELRSELAQDADAQAARAVLELMQSPSSARRAV
jgi:lipid A disaccharide synthetase